MRSSMRRKLARVVKSSLEKNIRQLVPLFVHLLSIHLHIRLSLSTQFSNYCHILSLLSFV